MQETIEKSLHSDTPTPAKRSRNISQIDVSQKTVKWGKYKSHKNSVESQLTNTTGMLDPDPAGDSESEGSEDSNCSDFSDGTGTYYYNEDHPTNQKYIGTIKDGQRHGFGIMHYKNKQIYTGEWNLDTREGRGIYDFAG
jgi:hypothetical protein